MAEKRFENPVKVRLTPTGKVVSVESTRQATDLLASVDWPGERDERHGEAVDTCHKVLDGHRSTVDARKSFEKVAREAGILLEPEDGSAAGESPPKLWFDRPVPIRQDKGARRDVKSVQGACEVLIDWPHARRGPFYQAAREKVEAALKGDASIPEAREAFAALCDHASVIDA